MADAKDFSGIGYEDFRRLAADSSLSKYERIGFPDSYRQGFESAIFEDIRAKLTALDGPACQIIDIGPGASDLPGLLIDLCKKKGHELHLVDSPEMLAHLPDGPKIHKVAGLFPADKAFVDALSGRAAAVLCYSVLHYALIDTALFRFIDSALALLAPGGGLLLGDIPNISKRKRFFASETGIRFHQAFMKTDAKPDVSFNRLEPDQIDDAVVFAILQRARAAGFDAYVLPQGPTLPMANRREDILILRP